MAFDEIKELRKKIDGLDKEIIELLNQRAEIALAIRNLKMENDLPVYDKEREQKIFDNLFQLNDGPLSEKQIEEIYKTILKCMKDFSD